MASGSRGVEADGRVTHVGATRVVDGHGHPHDYEVITVRVERARLGPKFEEHPVLDAASVREILRPSYEVLLGMGRHAIDSADGLPFLLLPGQLTTIPTVGAKITVATDGATPFLVEVNESVVNSGIENFLLQMTLLTPSGTSSISGGGSGAGPTSGGESLDSVDSVDAENDS